MKKRTPLLLASWLFLTVLVVGYSGCSLSRFETGDTTAGEQDLWIKEELIFGRDIPSGGTVTDDDWQQFLGEVVTPRFPNGFTVLNALGQYLMQDGTIVTEKSWVLVIFLPGSSIETNRAINQVIATYKERFHQESVLRATSPARVQFK